MEDELGSGSSPGQPADWRFPTAPAAEAQELDALLDCDGVRRAAPAWGTADPADVALLEEG